RAVGVGAVWWRLSGRNECHRARALAADLLQHGEIVARTDSEIAGNDLAVVAFGQNSRREASALVARERLLSERQRLRQKRRASLVQPALRIFENQLAVVILD